MDPIHLLLLLWCGGSLLAGRWRCLALVRLPLAGLLFGVACKIGVELETETKSRTIQGTAHPFLYKVQISALFPIMGWMMIET